MVCFPQKNPITINITRKINATYIINLSVFGSDETTEFHIFGQMKNNKSSGF
jgi:hypothetical protein